MFRFSLCLMFAFIASSYLRGGEDYHVDLSKVANAAVEDDGQAGNGEGGWSDEGVNDMYMYPPVETGVVMINNHSFNLLSPDANNGKVIVMLKGERCTLPYPESVTVAVPQKKGKYIYFLQNSTLGLTKQDPNYVVAKYLVNYADGGNEEITIRDGIELREWWTGKWWDNSEKKSWPIFMGQNLYSQKWRRYIGVWSMQWENPHPEKEITSIVLSSAKKVTPAIWAITISNRDAFADEAKYKAQFKRPDGAPKGYFAKKENQERGRIFSEAVAEGRLRGIRDVKVICPDMLAVTVDGALGNIGGGNGAGHIEKYQSPDNFNISSDNDEAYEKNLPPSQVGRQTVENWVGNIGSFPSVTLYWHTFYLKLPKPVVSGKNYRISVNGIDGKFAREIDLAYNENSTECPSIKVNQVAYAACSEKRYAYLGWWAGSLGTVDFSALKKFRVLEKSGKESLAGEISLRRKADPTSGEDVYQIDLSGLKKSGEYVVQIPGLGVSAPFWLGDKGAKELYYHTTRAFYHQRCGLALKKPFTEFERPACHLKVYESGYMVGNPGYKPRPEEAVKEFRGGYHDAGDDDCFSYHLRATLEMLTAYEKFPKAFKDGDLNLPESGNGIPDVLDEADWALFFYRDHQHENGAIPLGRGNDQDYISKTNWGQAGRPEFGILPPSNTTATEYAATAAQYSRLIRPYDGKRADSYLSSAIKAFDWALANPDNPPNERKPEKLFQAWAAAELLRTTGDDRYNRFFVKCYNEKGVDGVHWSARWDRIFARWSYAMCPEDKVDTRIQDECRSRLIDEADAILKQLEAPGYRMGAGESGCGWGNGNGGGHYGYPCILAYFLSGEKKYLDAASINADYQLGANPLSQTFITGLGVRHPDQPQISPTLYSLPKKTGETVKGISIYGPAGRYGKDNPLNRINGWYPDMVPVWRSFRDLGGGSEISSEFTITETVGLSASLYMTLYAIDK